MKSKTKKLVAAALLCAFTCVATMIIKLPTPTFGYIHLGDGLVLLCGIACGPAVGALAAGVGSMFADIFSGYAAWAPATFLIKALTACIAGFLFRRSRRASHQNRTILISGLAGETVMVAGYFLYETALAAFASGGFSSAALLSGAASSATGIPFNIMQGAVGIAICLLLVPVLMKIPDVRDQILSDEASSASR